MIERDSVQSGDTTIEYEVRRSVRRRKTVQISVDRGDVRVAAPATTPDSELRAIVRKRAAWILSHTPGEGTPEDAPRRFVSGETLPYLGRNVSMVVEPEDASSPRVRFDHWRFRVSIPQSLDCYERYERVRGAFMEWYRERAAERMESEIDRWWPRLGRGERRSALIRNQRRRWGSCAADGTLRFNWRVVMMPPALIEYIVVHELAHLTVMNHSADFWELVDGVLPDVQLRRKRLREAGRAPPL